MHFLRIVRLQCLSSVYIRCNSRSYQPCHMHNGMAYRLVTDSPYFYLITYGYDYRYTCSYSATRRIFGRADPPAMTMLREHNNYQVEK